MDPHQVEKQDSNPHQSQNSVAVVAQNGAMEGRSRSQWRRREVQNRAVEDL
jgi:hypothetical protein